MKTVNLRLIAESFVIAMVALVGSPVLGQVINGDFETGEADTEAPVPDPDLTGWTSSAIDEGGIPTSSLITVEASGSNHFAEFDTGDFASGPFVSTLKQTFDVPTATPVMSFDFSAPLERVRIVDVPPNTFLDSFSVSVRKGADVFNLLLVDRTAALADPFGTAPGAVAFGTPASDSFEHRFAADLSAFGGRPVTLLIDVVDEDDGLQLIVWADNFAMSADRPHVPEPSAFALLAFGILLLVNLTRRIAK